MVAGIGFKSGRRGRGPFDVGQAGGPARRYAGAMKLALIVSSSISGPRVGRILEEAGVDYYTRWENAKGKGRGSEPHLGRSPFGDTSEVTMVAFEEEAPLQAVLAGVRAANRAIRMKADRIRLFQLPLESVL
jgi:hypothetical protein